MGHIISSVPLNQGVFRPFNTRHPHQRWPTTGCLDLSLCSGPNHEKCLDATMTQPTGLCKAGGVLIPESSLERTFFTFLLKGYDLSSLGGGSYGCFFLLLQRLMLLSVTEPVHRSQGLSAVWWWKKPQSLCISLQLDGLWHSTLLPAVCSHFLALIGLFCCVFPWDCELFVISRLQ